MKRYFYVSLITLIFSHSNAFAYGEPFCSDSNGNTVYYHVGFEDFCTQDPSGDLPFGSFKNFTSCGTMSRCSGGQPNPTFCESHPDICDGIGSPPSPDKPCTDAGMVMTMTGQCAPADETWPPDTPGCGAGQGASLTVVGFGGRDCQWSPGVDTGQPSGGAADDPFQTYTPDGQLIVNPGTLGLTAADQPFDGRVQDRGDGGKSLLVGDGCSTGVGGCQMVDFDANGDIVGFTELSDDGQTMVGGFFQPKPATGFEPYFAAVSPSRDENQPVTGAVSQDHAWNPSYTGPLSPSANATTGSPVYSSSGDTIGRVRTVSSSGVGGIGGSGATLYYDANGNLCGGSRPCGYDTSAVGGSGVVGSADVNTGGGSGSGFGGGGEGVGDARVVNPCASDVDCWGDDSGPELPTGDEIARGVWGGHGGASGFGGDIYSPTYQNGFQGLYQKWRPTFDQLGWSSWLEYASAHSNVEGGCPQPPAIDLSGGDIIGGFGVQSMEIDCQVYSIGRALLAVAASLMAALMLIRN